jgi:hypothetical protein
MTIKGCGLFKIIVYPQATELYQKFCCQGLYVRLCDEKNALRFGIADQENTRYYQNYWLSIAIAKASFSANSPFFNCPLSASKLS